MFSFGVLGTKGGTGKSTTATSLAVVIHQLGKSVLLVDIDPQGSAASWGRRRGCTPTVVSCTSAGLSDLLKRAELANYDIAVVDGAAHDKKALVTAARLVDLSIICAAPTLADIEVSIKDRYCIVGRPSSVLLTQTPHTFSRRLASWHRAASSSGSVVDSMFGNRVDFQDSFAMGLGVTEWAPTSPAAQEVRAAATWILEHLTEVRYEAKTA